MSLVMDLSVDAVGEINGSGGCTKRMLPVDPLCVRTHGRAYIRCYF